MTDLRRPRLPSRPDPRVDDDPTPPSGMPARAPSAIDIVRDEQRDIRTRLGSAEERLDRLEDWTENSKVHDLKAKKRAAWWIERFAKVGETIVAAVLILAIGYAISRVACVPATHPPTKVEAAP